jgi:hypothetical protein
MEISLRLMTARQMARHLLLKSWNFVVFISPEALSL